MSGILSQSELDGLLWDTDQSLWAPRKLKPNEARAIWNSHRALHIQSEQRLGLVQRAGAELFVLLASFPDEVAGENEEVTDARASIRELVKDIRAELGTADAND